LQKKYLNFGLEEGHMKMRPAIAIVAAFFIIAAIYMFKTPEVAEENTSRPDFDYIIIDTYGNAADIYILFQEPMSGTGFENISIATRDRSRIAEFKGISQTYDGGYRGVFESSDGMLLAEFIDINDSDTFVDVIGIYDLAAGIVEIWRDGELFRKRITPFSEAPSKNETSTLTSNYSLAWRWNLTPSYVNAKLEKFLLPPEIKGSEITSIPELRRYIPLAGEISEYQEHYEAGNLTGVTYILEGVMITLKDENNDGIIDKFIRVNGTAVEVDEDGNGVVDRILTASVVNSSVVGSGGNNTFEAF
jgi:hypothetical protein